MSEENKERIESGDLFHIFKFPDRKDQTQNIFLKEKSKEN